MGQENLKEEERKVKVETAVSFNLKTLLSAHAQALEADI